MENLSNQHKFKELTIDQVKKDNPRMSNDTAQGFINNINKLRANNKSLTLS
jgi:hypothetical protein